MIQLFARSLISELAAIKYCNANLDWSNAFQGFFFNPRLYPLTSYRNFAPSDPRDFFVWLWEELFIGESYELPDVDSYKVVADMYEPLRSTRKQ